MGPSFDTTATHIEQIKGTETQGTSQLASYLSIVVSILIMELKRSLPKKSHNALMLLTTDAHYVLSLFFIGIY